jgi:translation initiation factor 4A
MLVLDEVDQLIARNLYENVSGIVRMLPPPRTKASNSNNSTSVSTPGPSSSFDASLPSPFYPTSPMPFASGPGTTAQSNGGRSSSGSGMQLSVNPERQTCIFSNTIPTDVINFSQSIQVREPVRVLVRREGGPGGSNESSTAGNLRHYYLYLALAGGASGRTERDPFANSGPGTIGSGRSAQRQPDSETSKSKEYKLEALVDLLQEYPLWQAIIHVGSQTTMDAVLVSFLGTCTLRCF